MYQKDSGLFWKLLIYRPAVGHKAPALQELRRLLNRRGLQVKRHDLPFRTNGPGQGESISAFADRQVNGEISRLKNLTGQLLTPGDDVD